MNTLPVKEVAKLFDDYREHSKKASDLLDQALKKIEGLEEIKRTQENIINMQKQYIEYLEKGLGR